MRLLCVGDVVGQAGRRCLKRGLRRLREDYRPDLIVVNGENSAGGTGITPQTAREIFGAGADVITTGNHVWRRREVLPLLESNDYVLRPANYPDPAPGAGVCIVEAAEGSPVAVVNLMGRLFMDLVDDPFRAIDEILAELDGRARAVVIDFHAEATSEKVAFGWHVDGRVTAVVGTHTHVPTADHCILPGGTAYVSDLGMTGAIDSVIGVEREAALTRFITQRPARLAPAEGRARLSGVLIEADPTTGRAAGIEPVEFVEKDSP